MVVRPDLYVVLSAMEEEVREGAAERFLGRGRKCVEVTRGIFHVALCNYREIMQLLPMISRSTFPLLILFYQQQHKTYFAENMNNIGKSAHERYKKLCARWFAVT